MRLRPVRQFVNTIEIPHHTIEFFLAVAHIGTEVTLLGVPNGVYDAYDRALLWSTTVLRLTGVDVGGMLRL